MLKSEFSKVLKKNLEAADAPFLIIVIDSGTTVLPFGYKLQGPLKNKAFHVEQKQLPMPLDQNRIESEVEFVEQRRF